MSCYHQVGRLWYLIEALEPVGKGPRSLESAFKSKFTETTRLKQGKSLTCISVHLSDIRTGDTSIQIHADGPESNSRI